MIESDSLFEVPLYFIKEYVNGWIILIFICIFIYFILLRNYYFNKEQFYDQSTQLKNIKEIENAENKITKIDNEEFKEDLYEEKIIENAFKKSKAIINNTTQKKSKNHHRNSKKYKGRNLNNYDDDYDNHDDHDDYDVDNTKDNKDNKDNKDKDNNKVITKKKNNSSKLRGTQVFEGFDPSSTPYTSIESISQNQAQQQNPSFSLSEPKQLSVNTTLFDKLNLNSNQIKSCKDNYTKVIATYIIDLTKLYKLSKSNEYLNTKTQFELIINRGIDNIIQYLNNPIKSQNILTRTSIKTDLMNILKITIENFIDKTNTELVNEMNKLATMNSTTLDYNTMLKKINESRTSLEEYIQIDKMVSNYSSNVNLTSKNINSVLDKSFILPIYERNFDKINQLVNSDFNNDETSLAKKYGSAYTNFLNEKKKEELDINPLRLASKIESGIVNMLTKLSGNGSNNGNNDNNGNNIHDGTDNNYDDTDIIEQYNKEYGYTDRKPNNINYGSDNPIPDQNTKLVNNTELNENANIYKDRGNRGNYLIDSKTQEDILEGFEGDVTTTTTKANTTTTKANTTTTKANTTTTKANTTDFIYKLLSGDFLQYVMDTIKDKMEMLYGMYDNKINSNNSNMKFNLEENMIPAGFLLFILSMLIYFIDTTS